MILDYVILIVFFTLFFIISIDRFSPAFNIFSDLFFPEFSKRKMMEYLDDSKTSNSQQKSTKQKILLDILSFDNDKSSKLPFFNHLKYFLSIIISCFISTIIFAPICYFIGKNNGFTILAIICYITLLIVCLFASTTASAIRNNRKNSIIYAIIILIISYFIITKLPLDSLDIRIAINTYCDINPKLLNIFISLFIGFVCYSFSNTALRYFEVFRVATQIERDVGRWRPCFNTFKYFGSKREMLITLYTMNPITTVVLFFGRRFVLQYDHDTLFDFIYLTIQMFVATFHMNNIKPFLQMLVNDTYRYLTYFEQERSKENGELFYKELNKQLMLLASNSIALIAYSAVIFICALMYIVSLFMSGAFCVFTRVFSLFFIATIDILISCNKFATVVIEP